VIALSVHCLFNLFVQSKKLLKIIKSDDLMMLFGIVFGIIWFVFYIALSLKKEGIPAVKN